MTRQKPSKADSSDARLPGTSYLKNYSLVDIVDLKHLQELQDSFAKANRIASSIVSIDGTPITRPSNYCQVCKIIRETDKGLQNCMQSARMLGEMSLKTQKPYCHFCESIGFLDAAAPIVIENVHMANWLIGQNSIGSVDETRLVSYAREIDADPDRMLKAFHEMDKMSEEHFRDKLDFLWLMANRLSNQAYQQLKHQAMVTSLEKSQKELNEYKNNLEEIVNQRTSELEEAIQRIQQISVRDALTGCFNRGGINEYLPKEMKRARRYNNPIAILICDLDHFKRINDTYGHQSGDLVLKRVVIKMQELIRQDVDWLARFGGEEFIMIMPLTDVQGAQEIAERLRQAIAEIPFAFSEEPVHVTASFGVSAIEDWKSQSNISHETLLNSADIYLYQAKSKGRNLVVAGPPFGETKDR